MNIVAAHISPLCRPLPTSINTMYCSNLSRLWPHSAFLGSCNHSALQYPQTCTLGASNSAKSESSSVSPNNLNLRLQFRSSIVTNRHSNSAWWQPPSLHNVSLHVHPRTHSTTVSNFTYLWHVHVSSHSVNLGLQFHMIMSFKCISTCT